MKREITWNEIDNYSKILANKFADSKLTCVIGIGRGGLIPAVIISHQLGLPLVPVVWQTRDGEYRTNLNTIIDALQHGDSILVVDDIVDDGKTMGQVVGMMQSVAGPTSEKPINILTATIFAKPKSTFHPNEFGAWVDNDEWIIFPWEAE